MIIYLLILLLLFVFSFQNTKEQKNSYIPFFACLLLLGIFRGEYVGTDNEIYRDNFNATTMNPNSWSTYTEFELGFSWFMALFKNYISNNFYVFRGGIFIVFMLGINFLIRRYCKNHILALFFLILFLIYTDAFNLMRQYTALGLSCFAIPLLLNKKNIIFYEIIIFFFTFLIHRSLIIMTILPIFIYVNSINSFFTKDKYLILLLCFSYVCVFMSDKLYQLIPFLSENFAFLGERYVGYIYTSIDSTEQISKISSLLNTIFAIYLVKICPNSEKRNLFFICFILSICVANILGAMSALFLRISTNLALFKFILFANIWYSIPNVKDKNIYRLIVCVYGIVLFFNAMIKNFGDVVPYDFIF